MQIREVLQELGYNLSESANEFRAKPIYRESDNPLSLRICKATGKWNDFGTGEHGEFKDLIKKSDKNLDISKFQDVILENRYSKNLKFAATFEPIDLKRDYSYWKGRGISEGTQDIFEFGIDTNWKLRGRQVFVIKNEDSQILGFDGRATWQISGNTPKWKKIGKKNNWIFPLQSLEFCQKSRTVILVESIGDCLSLYECGIKNVFVTFGLSISSVLMSKIIEINPKRIVIALNNDSDTQSGQKAAAKMKSQLSNFFDDNQIKIHLPNNGDFNELLTSEGKSAILDWYVKI